MIKPSLSSDSEHVKLVNAIRNVIVLDMQLLSVVEKVAEPQVKMSSRGCFINSHCLVWCEDSSVCLHHH